MKKVDFDEYADNYRKLMGECVSLFSEDTSFIIKCEIDLILKFISKMPETIFEFGCGIGSNLPFLSKAFPKSFIFASDISNKSLKIAKRDNSDISFFQLDKDKIDKKFDLIIVVGVLHHISPDKRIYELKKIKSLLNPKGEIFIFEHNPYNPVTRKLVRDCPFDSDAVLLKPKNLSKMLNNIDLEVNKSGYFLFIPQWLSKIRFLERFFYRIPLGGKYFIKACLKK